MLEELLGYIGGVFIMISFLPQAIKTHQTKSVKDLSLIMLLISLTGSVIYICYGLLIKKMPIVFLNVGFSVIALWLVSMKFMYEKKKK